MGLVLGVAAGAALVEILRARPPAPREVRVTVRPDAVPRRRAPTLADDAFTDRRSPRAGPRRTGRPTRARVDGRRVDRPKTSNACSVTRSGQRAGGVPTGRSRLPGRAACRSPPTAARGGPGRSRSRGGIDPMLAALRASAAASAEAAMAAAARAVATAVRPVAGAAPATRCAAGAASGNGDPEPRRAAPRRRPTLRPTTAGAERTVRARRAAWPTSAASWRPERGPRRPRREDALRAAQRAYDDHEQRDGRRRGRGRSARRARGEGRGPGALPGRARRRADDGRGRRPRRATWLHEINRINAETGDATRHSLTREREAPSSWPCALERTRARGRRGAHRGRDRRGGLPGRSRGRRRLRGDGGRPVAEPGPDARRPTSGAAATTRRRTRWSPPSGPGRSPRIFRLLRGDRAAMQELVDRAGRRRPARTTTLAARDVRSRRRDRGRRHRGVRPRVPERPPVLGSVHPGAGPRHRRRAVVARLSVRRARAAGSTVASRRSATCRSPLGYAGLDPMRIRHWPTEAEMADAVRGRRGGRRRAPRRQRAGDLTLGELVTMLGRRADGLADVWNEWGRVRPLLLDDALTRRRQRRRDSSSSSLVDDDDPQRLRGARADRPRPPRPPTPGSVRRGVPGRGSGCGARRARRACGRASRDVDPGVGWFDQNR